MVAHSGKRDIYELLGIDASASSVLAQDIYWRRVNGYLDADRAGDPEARIAFERLPPVLPEGVHRLVGMKRADGVGPPLLDEPKPRGADFSRGPADPITQRGVRSDRARCRGAPHRPSAAAPRSTSPR